MDAKNNNSRNTLDTPGKLARNTDIPLQDESFLKYPFDLYAELQSRAPLVRSSESSTWYVLSYDLAKEALTNGSLGKGPTDRFACDGSSRLQLALNYWPLLIDPPEHRRYRQMLCPHSSARTSAAVARYFDSALPPLKRSDSVDIMCEIISPIVDGVVGDIAGVPQVDRLKLFSLTERISGALLNSKDSLKWTTAERAYDEIYDWFMNRHEQSATSSISSTLPNDIDVEVSLFVMMVFAGRDALRSALGFVIQHYIASPDLWTKLQTEEAIQGFVKEVIRLESPVQYTWRRALSNLQLGQETINADDYVAIILGSANRDKNRFPDPDLLQLGRESSRSLAFGFGIHYCLGSAITMEIGSAAIKHLNAHRLFAGAEIVEGVMGAKPPFRGWTSLRVQWPSVFG